MKKDFKYGYDDISIVPEEITNISSRNECNPYDENGMLPIFAAPMGAVIDEDNIELFLKNKINVVIPRTIPLQRRMELGLKYNVFVALSLAEAERGLTETGFFKYKNKYKICIDIANGHMGKLIDVCRDLKRLEGRQITLMAGNIANPKTYKYYDAAGIDYVRCGIGGGSACITSSNTGTFYAYFSLIEEIYSEKLRIRGKCKIIADGNIKGYGDIQKALIFADYVMIGGLFNRFLESAGRTLYGKRYFTVRGYKILRPLTTLLTYGKEIPKSKYDKIWKLISTNKLTVWKEMYGMSTKKAQKKLDSNAKTKTSEGKVFYQKVDNTIGGWVENETDFLRSAMSYTNSRTLEEFHDCEYIINHGFYYNR